MSGTLYVVATPIGNLGDISMRAVQTLQDVDFIAAEDTRVTRKLLEYLQIKKQLVSYYEHNKLQSGDRIINRLIAGENCALVSDAGTPGISDPGEDLVCMCIKSGIAIIAIPGPCAAVTAISISGMPSGRFAFEGFLSTSRKSRYAHLEELKNEKRTMVFYEAPHKLKRTLNDIMAVLGNRRISISRELTKIHEETISTTLMDAATYYENNAPRGEYVLIIDGAKEEISKEIKIDTAIDIAKSYIDKGLSAMDAVKRTAEETGIPKNKLYNAVLEKRP